ncbi:hypothetical protein ACP4OV_023508 [Aristida adscensionis]
MDSGNSGSLQSSSGGGGGDDEFDSRGGGGGVDSSPLSALLRPSPSPSAAAAAFALHGSSLYGLQEFASGPPQQQQQQQPAGSWSGAFTGAAGASSSSSPRVVHADAGPRQGDAVAAAAPQPPRGSRKRTRASRRAPTTVLTTDTSNFRAMVQEFTGIPSPPFAAGIGAPAASLRTRFDHLFPSPSTLRSAAGAGADSSSLPPYLLRPFAQKLPTAPSAFPPFTSTSSSTLTSSIGVANANATTTTAATAAASDNPPLPAAGAGAGESFQLSSSALLRMQDPGSYLSFQHLLDTQHSSPSMFGPAGGFAPAPRLQEPSPSSSEFLSGIGSLTHSGLMGSSEGLHLPHPRSGDVHHHGDELSGVVAGGGGSCKLNYSTHAGAGTSSSAAAGADKPPDGGAGAPGPGRPGRGEGLDPWICTSE